MMGQDAQQIRRHKLIIDTDPGIGASSLPPKVSVFLPVPFSSKRFRFANSQKSQQ
jgi:hypothetical protein